MAVPSLKAPRGTRGWACNGCGDQGYQAIFVMPDKQSIEKVKAFARSARRWW